MTSYMLRRLRGQSSQQAHAVTNQVDDELAVTRPEASSSDQV